MSSAPTSPSSANASASRASNADSSASPAAASRCRASPISASAAGTSGHVLRADEGGLRRRRDRPQVVGLREPTRLRDELDVLPGLRVDRGDLGEPVAQQVGLLGEPPGAVATLDELGGRPAATRRAPPGSAPAARPPCRRRTGPAAPAARPGRSSRSWSFCPCTASVASASLPSTPTGTDRPPRWARERPSAPTVRTAIRVPSSSGVGPDLVGHGERRRARR